MDDPDGQTFINNHYRPIARLQRRATAIYIYRLSVPQYIYIYKKKRRDRIRFSRIIARDNIAKQSTQLPRGSLIVLYYSQGLWRQIN